MVVSRSRDLILENAEVDVFYSLIVFRLRLPLQILQTLLTSEMRETLQIFQILANFLEISFCLLLFS